MAADRRKPERITSHRMERGVERQGKRGFEVVLYGTYKD